MRAADGKAWFPPIRRSRDELPSFIGSWIRDSIWGWNRRDLERALKGTKGLRINATMTTAIDSDVWQIQSRPLGQGLEALRHGVNGPLGATLTAANLFVGRLDYRHLFEAWHRAKLRYTTTRHVANWFATQGLSVDGVLPIYSRPTIFRSTTSPSRSYVLVYVGKETDTTAVRMLLETRLPAILFGSKSVGWVMKALKLDRYPNARMLGRVTEEELRDLYSNASFTAFPFTEEPFGLVPVESMACGTPVLTYAMQGPGESVIDQKTGWLVRTEEELVRRAIVIFQDGYPPEIVQACLDRARAFSLDSACSNWNKLLTSVAAGQTGQMSESETTKSREDSALSVPLRTPRA